jgi:predicted HicB family RNase H-like nuclease
VSGTIVVRCPADLHVALVAQAERQGVSLNNLCVSLLAGGVHFKLPKRKQP